MHLDRLKDIKLHGPAKWFHLFFMTMTFPLRRPFKFLLILIVLLTILLLVPLTQGVSWKKIPQWYFSERQSIYKPSKVEPKSALPQPDVVFQPVDPVNVKTEAPVVHEPEIVEPEVYEPRHYEPMNLPQRWRESAVEKEENPSPDVSEEVSFEAPQIHNDPLSESQAVEVSTAIKTIEQNDLPIVSETVLSSDVMLVQPKSDQPTFRKDETLPLVYEEKPKHIKGKAMVFTPNELTVGQTYMFLYGIYTNPKKHKVESAQKYLEQLVKGKVLECDLVAYTYENLPTGICYLDGRSINQNLVDAGFADNVAL